MNTSIDDVLTDDHVRLDGLLRELRRAVSASEPRSSALRETFEQRLVRHMSWEESVLFPALVAADPRYPAKKIESLVIDHDRIREKLGTLKATILQTAWAEAADALDDLWIYLEGHNRDEEKGVYTDADRLLSLPERARLIGLLSE